MTHEDSRRSRVLLMIYEYYLVCLGVVIYNKDCPRFGSPLGPDWAPVGSTGLLVGSTGLQWAPNLAQAN